MITPVTPEFLIVPRILADGQAQLLATQLEHTGLVAGLAMFPSPSGGTATLLESFLLAAFVPVLVSLVLMKLLPSRQDYDFTRMGSLVRRFQS